MFSVRLPISSRLLVVEVFGEVKTIWGLSTAPGLCTPNSVVVQESTIEREKGNVGNSA